MLSAGHASALLWSLLHLTGVRAVDPEYEILGEPAVSLDDLKRFRQLGSKCPGHPEYRWTSGVETTSGPLGQGVATSVGMAIASQWLGARYNRDGFTLFDFDVYAQAGDGCMMEGVASEAASFAAHQRLSNLCWIYDSNRVTIEGHTDLTFTEDVAARFAAYGWNVETVADANDLEQAERAFHAFKAEDERPTLIVVHSHIGYGTPVEDTPKAHGEPLGPDGRQGGEALLRLARGRASSSFPRACSSTSRTGSARAAPRPRRAGRRGSRSTASRIRSSPTRSSACSAARSPTAGTAASPSSPPTRRGSRAATRPVRCSTRSPSACRGSSAAPPTSHRRRRRA